MTLMKWGSWREVRGRGGFRLGLDGWATLRGLTFLYLGTGSWFFFPANIKQRHAETMTAACKRARWRRKRKKTCEIKVEAIHMQTKQRDGGWRRLMDADGLDWFRPIRAQLIILTRETDHFLFTTDVWAHLFRRWETPSPPAEQHCTIRADPFSC